MSRVMIAPPPQRLSSPPQGTRTSHTTSPGPQSVSAEDLAALAREIAGQKIEVVHVDDDAFVAGLTGAGLPEEAARLYASFGASTRDGFLESVSSAVGDLTGEPPRSLRTVLTAASDELVAA